LHERIQKFESTVETGKRFTRYLPVKPTGGDKE